MSNRSIRVTGTPPIPAGVDPMGNDPSLPLWCDKDLSNRVITSLEGCGISTLGHLAAFTESGLLKVPNIGKLSRREIEQYLHKKGMCLGYLYPSEQKSIDELDISTSVKQLLKGAGILYVPDLVALAREWYIPEQFSTLDDSTLMNLRNELSRKMHVRWCRGKMIDRRKLL